MKHLTRIRHYIEAKIIKPILMFHGTSTIFQRDIMKHGLDPNVGKGRWSDEETESRPSRKSHHGIYFCRSGYTASTHAGNTIRHLGGNKLIIAAQIQLNSAFPDEDDFGWASRIVVNTHINSIEDNPYYICQYYVPLVLSDNPMSLDSFQKYKNYAYAHLRIDQNKRQNLHMLDEALLALIKAEMRRRLAFYKESSKKDSWHNRIDYDMLSSLNYFIRSHEIKDLDSVPSKYKFLFDIESQVKLEAERRQALDRVIRSNRSIARPDHTDIFKLANATLRMDQPVRFAGGNRIIAIFSIKEPTYDDKNRDYVITEIYGKMPEQFLDTYKERIGMKPEHLIIKHRST